MIFLEIIFIFYCTNGNQASYSIVIHLRRLREEKEKVLNTYTSKSDMLRSHGSIGKRSDAGGGKLEKLLTFNPIKCGQWKPTEAERQTKVNIIFLTD